jgi:predicted ATPase
MAEAGIRPSNKHRKVGDYQLGALLSEGASYQDWEGTVVAALNAWPLLLVLDNAEYVVAELVPLLKAALGGCPSLCVLVTSQAALKLPAEQVLRLGPLRLPSPGTPAPEALQCGALALFVQRAQAVQCGFVIDDGNLAAAIEVCRALDGLPLAIELAAARLPLLGMQGLSSRLDERLRLLSSGARGGPTRQQSLRVALDWSHGLLDAAEQTAFAASVSLQAASRWSWPLLWRVKRATTNGPSSTRWVALSSARCPSGKSA